MGGVFMKKSIRTITLCAVAALFCWSAQLFADRQTLREELIRFHVVANSDSPEDQAIKLQVRDAVLKSIQADLRTAANVEEAKAYLQESIPKLQLLVDQTLKKTGFDGGSRISLCKEPFDIRHYDTFTLPAGVYESLRIVIGEGMGKNWWCVSFPTLCIPATTKEFKDTAVGSGFSESLVRTLTEQPEYEIQFFFLNQLGKLENIFFRE